MNKTTFHKILIRLIKYLTKIDKKLHRQFLDINGMKEGISIKISRNSASKEKFNERVTKILKYNRKLERKEINAKIIK